MKIGIGGHIGGFPVCTAAALLLLLTLAFAGSAGADSPRRSAGILLITPPAVTVYQPQLNITEIVYNYESGKVMAGLENTGEGPLYYTLELHILVDGQEFKSFGTVEPALLEKGESAGNEYDLDLSTVPGGSISASALVKYGAARSSLPESAVSEGDLAAISYVDSSNVSVQSAKYDPHSERVLVGIKNEGDDTAFAYATLLLVDRNGTPVRIPSGAIREIDPSSLYAEEFPLMLSGQEIGLNKEATVTLRYGGRRGFLDKNVTFKVPLEQESPPQGQMQLQAPVIGTIGVAAIAILYCAYRLATRKKPETPGSSSS